MRGRATGLFFSFRAFGELTSFLTPEESVRCLSPRTLGVAGCFSPRIANLGVSRVEAGHLWTEDGKQIAHWRKLTAGPRGSEGLLVTGRLGCRLRRRLRGVGGGARGGAAPSTSHPQ